MGSVPGQEGLTIARNLSTRYLAIAAEIALGLVTLPFNLSHLGKSAYGLWTLTASVTAYFSVLDLGYSGALVKFVSQYRAKGEPKALNEILSTVFFVFAACGVFTCLVACGLAYYLPALFHLSPDQVPTGRVVLLITSVNVAAGMTFSVYGAVINGFQRYDLNNVVGTASGIITALVNFAVIWMGAGLVGLVIAITTVRLLTYWIYRANAYRVFQDLRIAPALVRRDRLREVTAFSVHMAVIDWANKLNYSMDAVVIGAFLNTAAVAMWAIGQRLAELTQRLANQLNDILFPTVVEHDTAAHEERLQRIFVLGTRLSLAAAVPLAGGMMLLAEPLITSWVGPDYAPSALVLQLLSAVVIFRVGAATGSTLLKGCGSHRLIAGTNMSAAVVNVALSIALVKPLGLAGVAIGTLIPVAFVLAVVVFPAACRRVGLTAIEGYTEAVWPSVWPAAVMTLYVFATRPLVPHVLIAVAVEYGIAVSLYGLTFLLLAISPVERQFYVDKIVALAGLRRTVRPRAFAAAPVDKVSEGA
jgi:O-antigen/teichoic acid export membrane protein